MIVELKKKRDILIVSLIVLLLNVSIGFDLPVMTAVIISLIFLCIIIFSLVLYKEALLYALCFFIPLSISIPIGGGSKLNAPSEILCAVLALYLVIKIILNYKLDRSFLKHPITILMIIDLGWMLITSCFSDMPEVSMKRFIVRVVYVAVYYVLFYELFKVNKANVFKVYLLHCAGMLIPIVFTLVNHSYSGFSSIGGVKASQPFYNDHTIYGAVLAFFIPFLFYYAFIAKQPLSFKLILIGVFALFVLSAFLSYSRAAWLSLLISTLVFIVISIRPKKIYVLGFIMMTIIAGFFLRDNISRMLTNSKEVSLKNDVSTHIKSSINVKTDVSNTERLNRWKCAWKMFLDKPWLGFGPGTYQFFYGAYQVSNDITVISTFVGNRGHAHSEYLNYLCEEGLVGCLIFIALVIAVCYRAVKIIYSEAEKDIRYMAAVLFFGLVTFFVHSLFNGFIETDKMAMPVFISMAAIVSLDRIKKTETDKSKQ